MVLGLVLLHVRDAYTGVAVHVHTSADCSHAQQHLRPLSASHLARFKIICSWLNCIVTNTVTFLLMRVNVEVCVSRCKDPQFWRPGCSAVQLPIN